MFIYNHYRTEDMEFVFQLRCDVRSDVIIAVMKIVVKVRLENFRPHGNCQCTAPASHRSALNIRFSSEFFRPSFHLCASESVQNCDDHVNLELQSSAEKNFTHIGHQLVTSTGYHELTYRLGPVVQSLDSAIQGINRYLLNKHYQNLWSYPVGSATHLLNN